MINGYEEIIAFNKGNVDAVVKSGSLAVKGIEELAKVYADYTGQSIEKANEAVKALAACKSPVEFVQLQSDLARKSFETFVSESRKVAELTSKVINISLQPLNERFNSFSEIVKPVAA
jgi:phasin family protein